MERLTPVCSPAYYQTIAHLEPVEQLRRGQILHCSGMADWQRWVVRAFGDSALNIEHGETFDTMDTALRAAEAGRGFAMADLSMIDDDLSLGRLVAPFRVIAAGADNFYLVRRDPPQAEAGGDALRRMALQPGRGDEREPVKASRGKAARLFG